MPLKSSFELINVVVPNFKIFFWIGASIADATSINSEGTKTLSAKIVSIFFINSKPTFIKKPRKLSNSPFLLQPQIKYLKKSLAFIWNSALREKINFYFQGFLCYCQQNFLFGRKIWHYLIVPWSVDILLNFPDQDPNS